MGANFDDASLEKAKLLGADCTGATFRRANCYEAKFIKAKLTGCVFTDCNLLWVKFKNSKGDVSLDAFQGADVGYADFTKSCITSAHLTSARNVKKATNIPPPKQRLTPTDSNDGSKKHRKKRSFGLIDTNMGLNPLESAVKAPKSPIHEDTEK